MRLPLALPVLAIASCALSQNAWTGFAGNPQHTGNTRVAARVLDQILWKAPVDLDPPYSGDHLLAHYGAPVITAANTVIFPVRTPSRSFRIQGRSGTDGAILWGFTTSYTAPPHNWYPSYAITLMPPAAAGGTDRVAWAESGGRVRIRANADGTSSASVVRTFYGASAYNAAKTAFDTNVKITTPLTAAPDGSLYFGYVVLGEVPNNLPSGVARIAPDGTGSFVAATTLSAVPEIKFVKRQSAPALTRDGRFLYTVVSEGNFKRGMLVALNAKTLQPVNRTALVDPKSGLDALVDDDGTASPLIGPDGDVFVGVLENSFGSNNRRGWLLHFSADLQTSKIPSAFGWDNTPSIVPSYIVPSYTGTSPYLLFTKYNEYTSWIHRIALVDPFDSAVEAISGIKTMKEIATQVCPTPDPDVSETATREWCINTAVVDVTTKCALANASDGILYRWNFATNTLQESIRLTRGIGEAYAPVAIGPDGKVYAINNAQLFAIGSKPR